MKSLKFKVLLNRTIRFIDHALFWEDRGFPFPGSPMMEGIIDLHNYIFTYLIIIFLFVLVIFCNIFYDFYYCYYNIHSISIEDHRLKFLDLSTIVHHSTLEIIWTNLPSFILLLISFPSFSLLYALEEVVQPTLTLKVVGHQWFWSYQYVNIIENEIAKINFNCFMVKDPGYQDPMWMRIRSLSEARTWRGCLDPLPNNKDDMDYVFEKHNWFHWFFITDNPVYLPVDTHIRVLITSNDVLHSWAVPSLGVKMDAVPGRLNQIYLYIRKSGIYYGQCSELCGINHGFMPISIKALKFHDWAKWVNSQSKVS